MTRKGHCNVGETELVVKFLIETGRTNSTLLIDSEPALINFAQRICKQLPNCTYRATPTYSPQSKGEVERRHQLLLSQYKTLQSDLTERYKLTAFTRLCPLFTWMIKHSCFLLMRYLLHDDGLTSYSRRWTKEYNSPLCLFGETIMYKLPQRLPNTTSAWGQGLWLGRCTLKNEVFWN